MSGTFIWLTPALVALFFYGIGQGLVKKYISEVHPARFCLYFLLAKALVNFWYFFSYGQTDPFAPESRQFLLAGIGAYILDGVAWILYFESIVAGPITIVGTLSAAYPALTVLFARVFLAESLSSVQYLAVTAVIIGCIGLSYAPAGPGSKKTKKRWIPFAASALVLWGLAQTIVKYSYGLPGADEANLTLFNTFGGALTLGVYGLWKGRQGAHSLKEWSHSLLPMGMMAGGDLAVIIASKTGPISIVTPVSGAYPLVTLVFAWIILKERISFFQWANVGLILIGIFFSPGSG